MLETIMKYGNSEFVKIQLYSKISITGLYTLKQCCSPWGLGAKLFIYFIVDLHGNNYAIQNSSADS